MKKKCNFLRRSLSLLLLYWITLHVCLAQSFRVSSVHSDVTPDNFKAKVQLKAKVDKKLYGWCLYDSQMPGYTGLVSFNTSNLGEVTPITEAGTTQYAGGGCYIDKDLDGKGEYYLFGAEAVAGGNPRLSNLMKVDMGTGKTIIITNYEVTSGMFHDVDYDYSSGKMYAVSNSSQLAAIYEIDLITGKIEHVGTVLAPLFTLAINFQGQMYAIGLNSNLYKINKEDWTVTSIGSTGAYPGYSQSMTFDHSDNTLYWAYFNNGIGKLMTVDTETAVATDWGNIGGNTQIVGLYAPFQLQIEQPRRVTDFTVIPGASGEEKAELGWKNPTENLNGTKISTLNKVEIYRDGELTGQILNPNVGTKQTWQDNEVRRGMHLYTVIAYTDVKGMSASQSIYIGKDVPNAARNVVLTNDGTNAVLRWTPVAEGFNGGWINKGSLKYRITRLPDKKIIGETADTTFTDTTISKLNIYTYLVESYNIDGIGGTASSNPLIIGPSIKLPYTCRFSTIEEFLLWKVIDIGEDGYSWAWNSYQKTACCQEPVGGSSNEWFFSPPLKLEANRKYRISYTMNSMMPGATESMKVTIGKEAKPDKQIAVLADHPEITNTESQNHIVEFTPSESGDYNLGIHCYSVGGYMISVAEVDIRTYEAHSLVALDLQGQSHPVIGKEYDYELKIKNMGFNAESDYTIDVLNEKGTVLKTLEDVPVIALNEESNFAFKWEPKATDEADSIFCRINLSGTGGSNSSPGLKVTIQPEGSAEYIEIGTGINSIGGPIATTNMYSGSQALYLKDEIKGVTGLIEKISYDLAPSDGAENIAIEVYMANTELASLSQTGMLPKDIFTKVFDGIVSIPASDGTAKWEIELDDKFLYLGENLVIMVAGITKKFADVSFLSYDEWQRFSFYSSNDVPFNYSCDFVSLFMPQINLFIQPNGGAVLNGVITESNVPIEGATVSIDTLGAKKITDKNGKYEFPYLIPGVYDLAISKFGYEETVVEGTELVAGQTKEVNVVINKLPVRKVSGICQDRNGTPIGGATIKLLGYDNLETTSVEDGTFTFGNVYAVKESYQVEAKKLCYLTYKETVSVGKEDVELQVRLSKVPYLPSPVTATVSDDIASVKWDGIARSTIFGNDGGNVSGQIGTVANEYNVMGTTFRTPAIVEEVFWYLTSEGGPHEKVNLFIFKLDEKGMPTTEILFQVKDVPSRDDQWSSYTLDTPVECLDGFLVGISYNGFIGLGLDLANDSNYPFKENTNFTCENYLFSKFATLESISTFKQNFMLRAKGIVAGSPIEYGNIEQNMKRAPDSSVHYKIWRCLEENVNEESKWTLLTANKIAETEYADAAWSHLPSGAYVYAVKAIYPGDELSGATFSNVLSKNMSADVDVKVTTRTNVNESKGATVTLINQDGNALHSYQQTVGAEGTAVFEKIWKGTYSLTIKHEGFHTLQVSDVEITKNKVAVNYELNERITNPYNLMVTNDVRDVIFTWNNAFALEDDFEAHENFAINSSSSFGWQYVDNDDCKTVVMGPATYPNIGSKMSGMIFNPQATSPALKMWEIQPYEGDKYLGIFASEGAANDDWIISPELNFPTDFVFEFYAKSMTPIFNLEKMKIAYSITGNQPNDFVHWVHEGDYIEPIADSWVKYSYPIPADAKYVAIHCISKDGFLLMIDNVRIGMTKPETVRPSVKYEVYLNGNLKSEVNDIRYVFEDLPDGTYKAGVKAIYNSGRTGLVEKEFTVNTSAINDINTSAITIHPNPLESTMYIDGTYDSLEILNVSGQCIHSVHEGNTEINVSDLLPGYYLIKLHHDGKVQIKKVIKI